jgi:hypothetical protein
MSDTCEHIKQGISVDSFLTRILLNGVSYKGPLISAVHYFSGYLGCIKASCKSENPKRSSVKYKCINVEG